MQCDGNRFIITNGMPNVKWLHPNAIYTTYELLPLLKMGVPGPLFSAAILFFGYCLNRNHGVRKSYL